MISLAESDSRQEEHLNFKLLTALFVKMPALYLYMELCDLIKNFLKMNLKGLLTLKKEMVL